MRGIRDEERVRRVRDALEAAGLQAVVCSLPENVLLLSGYWPVVGDAIAIATREGRVAVIVPEDERDLAESGWADDVRTFQPSSLDSIWRIDEVVSGPLEALTRKLNFKGKNIGREGGPSCPPASYAGMFLYGTVLGEMLTRVLATSRLESAERVLEQLKGRKTPGEVGRIRTACRVAGQAFRLGTGRLPAALKETEAAALFRTPLATLGTASRGSCAARLRVLHVRAEFLQGPRRLRTLARAHGRTGRRRACPRQPLRGRLLDRRHPHILAWADRRTPTRDV